MAIQADEVTTSTAKHKRRPGRMPAFEEGAVSSLLSLQAKNLAHLVGVETQGTGSGQLLLGVFRRSIKGSDIVPAAISNAH